MSGLFACALLVVLYLGSVLLVARAVGFGERGE